MKPRIYKMEDRWWLEWSGGSITFGTWDEALQASQATYLEYAPLERRGIVARILFRLYPQECIVGRN